MPVEDLQAAIHAGVKKLLLHAESKAEEKHDRLTAALLVAKEKLEAISESPDTEAHTRGPLAREALVAVDEALGVKK